MNPNLVMRSQSSRMVVAKLHNVIIGVCKDIYAEKEMDQAFSVLQEENKPVACILVLAPGAKLAKDAREAIQKRLESVAGKFLAMANVFMGRGLMVAGIRAVTGALMLMSTSKFPVQVFSSVDTAAEWVGKYGEGVSGREIASSVRELLNKLEVKEEPGSEA